MFRYPIEEHRTIRPFTLIELAIVIAIIAIATTLAGPRILEGMTGGGIDSQVNKLSALGMHAQNLAVTTGHLHALKIDLQEGEFYIKSPTSEGEQKPHHGNIHRLPEGIRFDKAQLENKTVDSVLEIRFAPDGWADNALIGITDEKHQRRDVEFTRSMGRIVVNGE